MFSPKVSAQDKRSYRVQRLPESMTKRKIESDYFILASYVPCELPPVSSRGKTAETASEQAANVRKFCLSAKRSRGGVGAVGASERGGLTTGAVSAASPQRQANVDATRRAPANKLSRYKCSCSELSV